MKALVTGATSGIGKNIAKYLSNIGYDLIIVARRQDKLEQLKQEVKTDCKIICTDLSSKDNCINLYNNTKSDNIDILINNAGFGIFGEFNEIEVEKEIGLINTNIIATHILTKLFLKDMLERNQGYILNVSSIASFMPGPLMSSYYASKAYITRLSQGINKELKKHKSNVSISILCPGPVLTEFNNVAGVNFSIKPLSSQYVVKYTIDKMFKRKLIIIPGFINKCARVLSKISPDNLVMNITYNIQHNKSK